MSKIRNKNEAARKYGYLLTATVATMAGFASVEGAIATPVNPPGWTAGLQLGAPLPEGLYFVDTGTYFERSNAAFGSPKIDAVINLPVMIWSTPATLLGGRLELLATIPEIGVGINPNSPAGSSWHRDIYNYGGLAGLAFDLGGGWSIADHVGFFGPVDTDVGNNVGIGGNFWTFVESASVAYNHDGWALSANFFYGHSFNDNNTGIHTQPDSAQVDFAATKHIGKWEVGLVGYGSSDLGGAARDMDAFGFAHPQQQFALGGLVGYNFGPVITQFYVTRDVAERNYTGYDTRFWGRLVVPLWAPPAPAPLVAKY
jgi:hypothetical protein